MTTTKFMNDYGQNAVLITNDATYRYYQFDDETVIRVDDDHQVESNPYWEYDILMDDLNRDDIQIEYIADGILDYLLYEKDLRDFLSEEAIGRLVDYQMMSVLNELDWLKSEIKWSK